MHCPFSEAKTVQLYDMVKTKKKNPLFTCNFPWFLNKLEKKWATHYTGECVKLCFCSAVCLLVRLSLWKIHPVGFFKNVFVKHTHQAHTHGQGVGHRPKHRSEKSLVTLRLSTCIYGLLPGTSEGFLSGSKGLRRGHALHLVMMMLEKSKPRRVTRWWDFSCR